MSSQERWADRDRVYSNWHRQACAPASSMIDVDGLEYCDRCCAPLLLVEAARDVGQPKATYALKGLAVAAKVPAICVMWTATEDCPPLPPHCDCQRDRRRRTDCNHGVASVRVRRIWPDPTVFVEMTADELATYIDRRHVLHVCGELLVAARTAGGATVMNRSPSSYSTDTSQAVGL